MASSPQQAVAWAQLREALEEEDFEAALSRLDPLIAEGSTPDPVRNALFQCQVFCLIQQNRPEEALRLCQRLKDTRPEVYEQLHFEVAYALYKLNRLGAALAVANAARRSYVNKDATQVFLSLPVQQNDAKDRPMALLEAQLLYRMGYYNESATIYKQLMAWDNDNLLAKVNFLACQTGLGTATSWNEASLEECQTSDSGALSFNAACLAIELGRFDDAVRLLDLATEQCEAIEEPDVSAMDLKVQQTVVLQHKHSSDSPHETLAAVYRAIHPDPRTAPSLDEDADPATAIVAANNLAVLESNSAILPVIRGVPRWMLRNMLASSGDLLEAPPSCVLIPRCPERLTGGFASPLCLRLQRSQLVGLIQNHVIRLFKEGKPRECLRYIESLPHGSRVLTKLRARLLEMENQHRAASEFLLRAARASELARGETELDLRLWAAVMALNHGHKDIAVRALKSISVDDLLSKKISGELLPSLLNLMRGILRPKAFHKFYVDIESLCALTSDSTAHNDSHPQALLVLGNFLLDQQRFELAHRCFAFAESQNPDDPALLRQCTIGRLRASSRYDFALSATTLTELRQRFPDIFKNQNLTLIDPDDVDEIPLQLSRRDAKLVSGLLDSAKTRALAEASQALERAGIAQYVARQKKSKKKTKRKPRYPKGFDPENPGPPPDPERWLPKHERTTFKKTKKGAIKTFRGAQGQATVTAATEAAQKKVATTANVELKEDTQRRRRYAYLFQC